MWIPYLTLPYRFKGFVVQYYHWRQLVFDVFWQSINWLNFYYYSFSERSLAINTHFAGINETSEGVNFIYARKNNTAMWSFETIVLRKKCKQTQRRVKSVKRTDGFIWSSEMYSSQESDLAEEDLDKLVDESEPETTKRSTSWGLGKFQQWMDKRSIIIDLKTVSEERLNETHYESFMPRWSRRKRNHWRQAHWRA